MYLLHKHTHIHTQKHTLAKEYSSEIYLYEKYVIFGVHIGHIHQGCFFYIYDFYT